MDATDLRFFDAVARAGGMNRAAADLNTVQSNVTSRIRALEAELRTELFRRHSRGVELTAAGRRLLPYARKVAWTLAEARRAVADDGRPRGPLVLGSTETTAAARLPPLLSAFGIAHPDVDLSLTVAPNADLIRRVLDYELDGAFACATAAHPDLCADEVFLEELVLATPGHLPPSVPVFTPGCKILVKGGGCAYRERLERIMAGLDVQGHTMLEFGTADAIVSCVEAGLGLTMLPKSALERPAREGRVRLHSIDPGMARIETHFVRRRDARTSSAMGAFLKSLEDARSGLTDSTATAAAA